MLKILPMSLTSATSKTGGIILKGCFTIACENITVVIKNRQVVSVPRPHSRCDLSVRDTLGQGGVDHHRKLESDPVTGGFSW
jgi:hypothetical protein